MNSEKVEEYTKRFQRFFDMKLCFTPEELQVEHIRLLNSLPFNEPVIPEHIFDPTMAQIDRIFSNFVQENMGNLARFESLKKRGEINCIRKFREMEAKLAVSIQENPFSISFNVTQEELQHFFDTSVQLLPENWKEHLSVWYFEQIKEFRDDIEIVVSMIRQYKENLQKQISSQYPICVEATDFQAVHAQSFAIAQGVDLNHPWKHKTRNQHAYTAIENIRETFFKENSKIIHEENELIEKALKVALELHKNLMSSKMKGGTLLGQIEIENIHQLCTQAIVSAFLNVPYSYLRKPKDVQGKLIETLQHQLALYVEERIVDETKNVAVVTPRAFSARTAVSKPTATVAANPATVTSNPATVTSNPATVTSNPATVTSNPATTTAGPGTVNASLKTSTPTGVGLYLHSAGTTLGVYQGQGRDPIYVKFPPFITFGRNCGPLMSELPKGWEPEHNIHIYEALTAGTSAKRKLPICNEFDGLMRTEEIAGIYFSQIKSRAEELIPGETKVKSCVVSLSAFIPTGSKHMLKDALKLAGFDQCILLHATTAIGISYIHSYSDQFKNQNRAVLVHLTSSQFEVALADLSPTSRSLEIRRVNSDQYNDRTTNTWPISLLKFQLKVFRSILNLEKGSDFNHKLKTSICGMFSALDVKQDHSIPFVVSCGGSEAISEGFKVVCGVELDSASCILNEDEGIVFGAAVLDAMKHDRNMNLRPINYKEPSVDEFLPPPGARRAMGMTRQEFESASEKLNLFKLWEGNTAGNSRFKHVDQPLVRSTVSPESLSNINSRTELAELVSVIKSLLENHTGLNPLIVGIIKDGLKKSKEALQNPDTKGRQIEGLVRQMEFAASQLNTYTSK